MLPKTLSLLALCMFLLTTGTAHAVSELPPHTPDPAPPHYGESREIMEQVMITRLSRRLNLTDEQSVLLTRRFSEVRERQRALRNERMKTLNELRQALRANKEEEAVRTLLAQLADIDERMAAFPQEMRRPVHDLDLDVWQQAEFELFLNEFERQMRRILQHVDEHRRMGPPPGGRMGGPNRPPRPTPPELPRRERRPDGRRQIESGDAPEE